MVGKKRDRTRSSLELFLDDNTTSNANALDSNSRVRLAGPLGHLFYLQLDRVVVLGGALGIITKIAVDQLLFTPPLTFGYFVFQHLLSAPSPSLADASTSAAGAVWPVLKVNWVYWSLVHVVTFSMVPLSYRVGFVAVKNFFWGAYLSMVGARTTAAARAGASAQGEAQSGTLAASEKARNLRLARTATQ